MDTPFLPAGIEPGEAPGALPVDDPADRSQPQPTFAVVSGGGDTTAVRATLHAVPRS